MIELSMARFGDVCSLAQGAQTGECVPMVVLNGLCELDSAEGLLFSYGSKLTEYQFGPFAGLLGYIEGACG